jgi:hypothetical protein
VLGNRTEEPLEADNGNVYTFVALVQNMLMCDYLQSFTEAARTSLSAAGNSAREPNVHQCDVLQRPEQQTIHNVLADPDYLCQSERYSSAFQQRRRLRSEYLGIRFPAPARPVRLQLSDFRRLFVVKMRPAPHLGMARQLEPSYHAASCQA